MKIRNIYASLIIVVTVVFVLSACAGGGQKHGRYSFQQRTWSVSKGKLPPSSIKLTMNDKVRAWIDYYTGSGRERFERYLTRSGSYMPLMKEILRDYGIPEDVVYIALIESGFSAGARSYASAVGFWQFIRSTGLHYGLRIDPFVDERSDFIKSTNAAAQYLSYLYNMFGDWYLAFAAYNSGEGKIGRAIKKYGTNDFWQLSSPRYRYLRAETKDYVPKYIAATIIAKNPKKYGFSVKYDHPLEYDIVKASTQTDHETIARCSRSNYETIVKLNPELVMGATPPGERNYTIRVPKGSGKVFYKTFARLPVHQRTVRHYAAEIPRYHIVKKGESLARIAHKYGVSAKKLMAMNNISNPSSIRKGWKLKIPGEKKHARGRTEGSPAESYPSDDIAASYPEPETAAASSPAAELSSIETLITDEAAGEGGAEVPELVEVKTKVVNKYYHVKKGDTLGKIARLHGVTASVLKDWNKLSSNTVVIGKKLIVGKDKVEVKARAAKTVAMREAMTQTADAVPAQGVPPAGGVYKVKKGDTWWGIAEANNMTVDELKAANPDVKDLKYGRAIRLAGGAKPEPTAENTTAADKAAPAAVAEKTAVAGEAAGPSLDAVYTVAGGDTLYSIARKNKVSVADICRINNLSRQAVIKPGAKLRLAAIVSPAGIPPVESGASERLELSKATPPSAAGEQIVDYKVKKGDTVWNIAKRHNTTLPEIRELNSGADLAKIKPGDVIRLKLARKGEL